MKQVRISSSQGRYSDLFFLLIQSDNYKKLFFLITYIYLPKIIVSIIITMIEIKINSLFSGDHLLLNTLPQKLFFLFLYLIALSLFFGSFIFSGLISNFPAVFFSVSLGFSNNGSARQKMAILITYCNNLIYLSCVSFLNRILHDIVQEQFRTSIQ